MPLEGPWGQLSARVNAAAERAVARAKKAVAAAAVVLASDIRAGIVSQAPGGQAFVPIRPMTIFLRLERMGAAHRKRVEQRAAEIESAGGTAHKRLIDHGDLLRSITYGISADGMTAKVGVLRSAKTRDGHSLVDIARIQTEGRVIAVTPKMRGWLHYHGVHLSPSTTHLVIFASPFIEPVFAASRAKLEAVIRGVWTLEGRAPVGAWKASTPK